MTRWGGRVRGQLSAIAVLACVQAAAAQGVDPTGVWNLTFKVGHIGEGLRTVIIDVDRDGDRLTAFVNGRQNRMVEADEVSFDGGVLRVIYGSYEYVLTIGDQDATGSVSSPTGTQEVTATRQESRLFAGDEPPPLEKTWRGDLTRDGGALVLRTRRSTFQFLNATEFVDQLGALEDEYVSIAGQWIVDKIRIEAIAIAERPRRR